MADKQVQPVTPRLGINCGEAATCPYVSETEGPKIIQLLEERKASIKSIMAGLAHGEAPTVGNSYVLELDQLRRKCPDAPVEQIAQMAIRKDIDMKHLPWNRRVWRTIEKSEGMVTQMVLNQPRVVFRQTPSRLDNFTRSEHAGRLESSPTCSGLPAVDFCQSLPGGREAHGSSDESADVSEGTTIRALVASSIAPAAH